MPTWVSYSPLKRLGKPNDIADVVAFIVSEEAGWLTGQIIQAGGGIVMDIDTGEVLSLVSLPDFNPNQENKNFSREQQNRMTAGV